MGLFKQQMRQQVGRLDHMITEHRIECRMAEEGWQMWPPSASDDEKQQALANYLNGKTVEWYPPDYQEPEPLDFSGKLHVDPEPVRRKLFGLF